MKITAKEILADKGNIYKNMSESDLYITIYEQMEMYERLSLAKLIKSPNGSKLSYKLWQRWHYKDGRPKPPRVHEVTRLRNELDQAYNKIMELKGERVDLLNKGFKLVEDLDILNEKARNLQTELEVKRYDLLAAQGSLNLHKKVVKWLFGIIVVFILSITVYLLK